MGQDSEAVEFGTRERQSQYRTFYNENEYLDDFNVILLIEDNSDGMTHDKMRGCMSLGYSEKSKLANTIDGNGFKTSTMRLGADVLVFTHNRDRILEGIPTQSIWMLSYTFLMETGKQEIVVPMIDFEKRGECHDLRLMIGKRTWIYWFSISTR
ncbi:histidine kinase-like ATPase, C-terminal domain-containing protein [Artemisia annua]|uniref:Histidine kinase-like ATPase, C-terminal domain-containing protein n=1 Tax=Artemisia annua TaxID=35608 RepID=A0A2U1LBK9_ARTAN|nr:histidine kinase-like ATPase, C-terminal domain-containing protein [Artemisia annua]